MTTFTRQKGAVLVVSLIILLVLTLIGVSGARSVVLGERMTFASRDAKVAMEVAESMLRQGEAYIDGLSDTAAFGSSGWLRTAGSGPDDLLAEETWTNENSVEWSVAMGGADGNPMKGRIYIEMAGQAADDSSAADVDISAGAAKINFDDTQVFKIVARGVSAAGTERVLMTFYGKAL